MKEKDPERSGWDGWEARGIEDSQLGDTVFRHHDGSNREQRAEIQPDTATATGGSDPDPPRRLIRNPLRRLTRRPRPDSGIYD